MSTAIQAPGTINEEIEKALIHGDLAALDVAGRIQFYNATCHSLGLNPLTKPFAYITLNGKLQLYALKDCTEQLRKIHGVSITSVVPSRIDELLVVVASALDREGKTDSSTGAVSISQPEKIKNYEGKWVPNPKAGENIKGEDLANAMMKAETKAKRRVTLSICGLGILDETEVATLREQGAARDEDGKAPAQIAAEEKWNKLDPPQPIDKLKSELKASLAEPDPQQPATGAVSDTQAAQSIARRFEFIEPNMLICTIRGVQEPNTGKKQQYLTVTFNGHHKTCNFASCFDTKLWPVLRESVGKEVQFALKEADKGGLHYINITDVLKVEGVEYAYGEAVK